MNKWFSTAGVFVAMAASSQACVLKSEDDASRFQEVIPRADHVKVAGPEDAQGSGSSSQSIQSDEPWADGPWAKYYGFTRHVRKSVNQVAGAVLGSVWIIVHTKPTSVDEKEATWGPWTDSLEPVTYQFRVTEVAEDEYEYRLEGRPKNTQGEFRTVLLGKGWGKGHSSHGDGSFMLDLDVAHELDPFNGETGKIKITHDLPPNITSDLFSQPRTITAEQERSRRHRHAEGRRLHRRRRQQHHQEGRHPDPEPVERHRRGSGRHHADRRRSALREGERGRVLGLGLLPGLLRGLRRIRLEGGRRQRLRLREPSLALTSPSLDASPSSSPGEGDLSSIGQTLPLAFASCRRSVSWGWR